MGAKQKQPRAVAGAAKRRKLVERLWSAAEAQVADIETRLASLSGDGTSFERDARALGLLAKFLKELVSIECLMNEASTPAKAATLNSEDEDAPPRNLEDFRRELARRLDQMRAGRELEPGSDPAEPELA